MATVNPVKMKHEADALNQKMHGIVDYYSLLICSTDVCEKQKQEMSTELVNVLKHSVDEFFNAIAPENK